jgi:hypothetical protein
MRETVSSRTAAVARAYDKPKRALEVAATLTPELSSPTKRNDRHEGGR